MENKKILLICPQPFLINRGTPLAILNIIKAIIESGYEIDLVTTHIGKSPKIKGLRIHRISNIPFLNDLPPGFGIHKIIIIPFMFLKALRLILTKKYEAIVSLEDGGIYGGLMRIIFRKKHIHRIHSIPTQAAKRSKILRSILTLYEKFVFSNSDVILTLLKNDEEIIRKRSITPKIIKIDVIPAMKEEKVSKKRINQLRKLLKIKKDDKVILWIGNLAHYQGSDLFFESLRLLNDFIKDNNLKILMASGKEYKNEISIKTKGINNIIYYNPSFVDMPNLVNIGSIGISLRDEFDAFPSKVKVFLRAGKPIIASDSNIHKAHLKDGYNALIVKKDPESIASAIKKLSKNKKLRNTLARNSKDYYNKNFSWNKYVESWNKAFKAIK